MPRESSDPLGETGRVGGAPEAGQKALQQGEDRADPARQRGVPHAAGFESHPPHSSQVATGPFLPAETRERGPPLLSGGPRSFDQTKTRWTRGGRGAGDISSHDRLAPLQPDGRGRTGSFNSAARSVVRPRAAGPHGPGCGRHPGPAGGKPPCRPVVGRLSRADGRRKTRRHDDFHTGTRGRGYLRRRQRLRPPHPAHHRGGAAGAAPRLLHAAPRCGGRAAGGGLGGLPRARRHLVATRGRRLPGAGLRPSGLGGPRPGPPAGLPAAPAERDLGPALRQPRHRHELRLVDEQAHPPPRQPQPRGPRPRRRPGHPGVVHRPGPCRQWSGPPHRRPPGVPLLPAADPGGIQPARRERAGTAFAVDEEPSGGEPPALPAHGGLPVRALRGAPPGQGGGVPRRAPVPVRRLPRLHLRAEPQGHADLQRRRTARLPATPGAHLPQRARRTAHRRAARRAQPPDRAPPVPEHAHPPSATRAAGGARVLRRDRCAVPRDRTAPVLPRGTHPSAPGGGTDQAAAPGGQDRPGLSGPRRGARGRGAAGRRTRRGPAGCAWCRGHGKCRKEPRTWRMPVTEA
ncbi:hypothetical protein SGPA1_30802 [Streptomyces misionensis JCM 4497]